MHVRGIGGQKIQLPDYPEDWSLLGRGKSFREVVFNSYKSYSKPGKITKGQLEAQYYEGFKEGYLAPDVLAFKRGQKTPEAAANKISDLYKYEPVVKLAEERRNMDLTNRRMSTKDAISYYVMTMNKDQPTPLTVSNDLVIASRKGIQKWGPQESVRYVVDLRSEKIPKDELNPENYPSIKEFMTLPELTPKRKQAAFVDDPFGEGEELKIQKGLEYAMTIPRENKRIHRQHDIHTTYDATKDLELLDAIRDAITVERTTFSTFEESMTPEQKQYTNGKIQRLTTAYKNLSHKINPAFDAMKEEVDARSEYQYHEDIYNAAVGDFEKADDELIEAQRKLQQIQRVEETQSKNIAFYTDREQGFANKIEGLKEREEELENVVEKLKHEEDAINAVHETLQNKEYYYVYMKKDIDKIKKYVEGKKAVYGKPPRDAVDPIDFLHGVLQATTNIDDLKTYRTKKGGLSRKAKYFKVVEALGIDEDVAADMLVKRWDELYDRQRTPHKEQKKLNLQAKMEAKRDQALKDAEAKKSTPKKQGSKSVKEESVSKKTPVKGKSPSKPGRGRGKK